MSQAPATTNPTTNQEVTQQQMTAKEISFRQLEDKHKRELQAERLAREEAERRIQELTLRKKSEEIEDDEVDEPYVDHRRLNKKLQQFGELTQKQTQSEIQKAVQDALQKERESTWIRQNPDFVDVLSGHADKIIQNSPELAEAILAMPEGFERQKLVYHTIKRMGLDRPAPVQPSIQDKIDQNRRSPFYQPTGVAHSPGMTPGDFSAQGKKAAYEKMLELKSRMRI